MNNASNCNTLASILAQLLPSFGGEYARLRCLAHIINLIAKVYAPDYILCFLFL